MPSGRPGHEGQRWLLDRNRGRQKHHVPVGTLTTEETCMAHRTEILVCFFQWHMSLLIPKKRGNGFQKVPLGHKVCPLSSLAYKIGYDVYGLDGALDVQTGWIGSSDQDRLVEKVVKPIADLLGYPWRVVDRSDFWSNHPTCPKHETTSGAEDSAISAHR